MSYQLHITSTAEHDIMRAVDYIEFTLNSHARTLGTTINETMQTIGY